MIEPGLAAGSGEEAIVPDAMEAPWQDVKEEAADELADIQRQGAMAGSAILLVVFDAESDVGSVECGDTAR